MRHRFVVRISVLLLASWLIGLVSLRAAPSLRNMGNSHFEIVGLDVRSVSFVNELSAFAIQIADRYLDRRGMTFPRPILVSLRPEAHAPFEGDYRIRIEERGSVELDIRWEESTTLEGTCRALSEALLVQYAVYNHGLGGAANLRAWPVEALAQEIYIALRPAYFIDLVEQARLRELPELTSVAEAPLHASDTEDLTYSYWLLEVMKSGGLDRPVVRSLFQQAVAGIDIEEALAAAVQPTEPTDELLPVEMWWSGQVAALLGREYEVVETMETSREWLASLARFNAPLELESDAVTLNLRSIWKHRAQSEVQELIRARYEILLLRMARINPAYYNPARSLGVLYEALLDGEAPAHKYLHALVIYLSDWEDAKDMQEKIEEKL